MISAFRRTLSVLLIIGLLASNILSLTWEAFQVTASGLLAAASIPTVYSKRAAAAQQKRLVVKKAGANIRKRTLRSAAVNVGSMAGEAVPYVGIAVIAGATIYELKLACDNLLDLESLYVDFDIEADADRSAVEKICDPDIPTSAAEITDWGRELVEFDDKPATSS